MGFIAYDPEMAKKFFDSDPIIAIYYLKLSRYDVVLSKDEEGFFTRTTNQIYNDTCITRKQQERARHWLVRQGHIHTTLKIPAGTTAPQVHYRIIDGR